MRLPAPVLIDAAGEQGFGSTMRAAAGPDGATVVTVTADRGWLTAPGRVFPVTVDPSPLLTATQDCHLVAAQPTTSFCDSLDTIEVGYSTLNSERHGLAQFDTASIPLDATVVDADLALYRVSYGGALPIDVAKVTQAWDATATWNNATTGTAWTTPGAPTDGVSYTNFGQETVSTATGWHHWSVPDITQQLVNDPDHNFGVMLRRHDTTVELARFESVSNPAGHLPELSVTWAQPVGDQKFYSYTDHRLNDRSGLRFNNGSGNLLLRARDIQIGGAGLAVNVDRFSNSLRGADPGVLGTRNRLSVGPDVSLIRNPHDPSTAADNTIDYVSPSGTAFLFGYASQDAGGNRHYTNPSLNADLADSGVSGTTATLTFHGSGEQYTFGQSGCADCFHQTGDLDRNKNKVVYSYSGAQLAAISHYRRTGGTATTPTYAAADVTVTAGYNSAGYLNSFTESGGPSARSWLYGYTGDQLTSYTDPAGKVTDYTYSSADDLTVITDPAPLYGADRPTTTIGYNTGHRPTQITYLSAVPSTGYTYTFGYDRPYAARCTTNTPLPTGSGVTKSTDVTDPNGAVSTFCYTDRGLVKRAVDGAGHDRDTAYSPADDVSAFTDTNGQSYALNHGTNTMISSIVAPKSSGSTTAATTSFDYSGSTGTGFLPTSTTDTQGNCTAAGYDTAGNLTDTYAGNSPSGGNCNTATGGAHNHLTYRVDGGVDAFTDARGNTTDYVYDADGNPTQIRQPGYDCATTTARKRCTDLTYDGLRRVHTARDGNNQLTTYTYDPLDRITAVYFGGATSCDAGKTNCVTYTYDAEGNLKNRADVTGVTYYTYDLLKAAARRQPARGLLLAAR